MQHNQLKLGFIGLGFITGLAFGSGACRGSEPDPNHCARQSGNTACTDEFGSERPYCLLCGDLAVHDNGCVEDEPTDLNCYSPCGGMQSFNDNSSCLETQAGDGDGDGGGGGGAGGGNGDGDVPCTDDQDCDAPDAPFCELDSGACVSCDGTTEPDASCAELDADSPICLAGSCVACTADRQEACSSTTPICDVETNTCVGCSDHAQCPDSACNFAHGNCFNPTSEVHVNNDEDLDLDCDDATGTADEPYCTITDALAKTGAEAFIMLHEIDDEDEYIETISISKPVAIIGVDGELPLIEGASASPAITVTSDGVFVLQGVEVHSGDGTGISIDGGSAWVETSRIVDNDGGGISVDGGGKLVIENSFVGGNILDAHVIDVLDGSASVLYSTLLGGDEESSALRCADDAGPKTTVRNSILATLSEEATIACAEATFMSNVLEPPVDKILELDNVIIEDELETDWFTNIQGGDFHLAVDAPDEFEDTAIWKDGDPKQDIDGDPRVTHDAHFAGADVP